MPSIYSRQATVSLVSNEFPGEEITSKLVRNGPSIVPGMMYLMGALTSVVLLTLAFLEFTALLKCLVSDGLCKYGGYASISLNNTNSLATISLVLQHQPATHLYAELLGPDGSRKLLVDTNFPITQSSTSSPLYKTTPAFSSNDGTENDVVTPTYESHTASLSPFDYFEPTEDAEVEPTWPFPTSDIGILEATATSFFDPLATTDGITDSADSYDTSPLVVYAVSLISSTKTTTSVFS